MRPKSLVLLILALGCGLIASIGISEIIDSQKSEGVQTETEAILVAKVDIERSTVLTAENLMMEDWPKDRIPSGAIKDLAEIEGRRPVIRIGHGLPILDSMVGEGEGVRAASEIPKGYRVVAVRVTDESGANLIRPGDRVDLQLYARRNVSVGIEKTGTWTFLQDVSVFAVNEEISPEVDSEKAVQARTVSLLVTPAQAAKVTLATEVGEVRLIMRGAQDDEGAGETVASISDLMDSTEKFEGEEETPVADSGPVAQNDGQSASMLEWLQQQQQALAAVPPEPEVNTWQMVVLRGADISVEEFQEDAPLSTKITAASTTMGAKEPDATTDATTDVKDPPDDTQQTDSADDSVSDSDTDDSQDD